jgi:uncharacterized protein (TIGR03435 family)
MWKWFLTPVVLLHTLGVSAQTPANPASAAPSFEVATIKPVDPGPQAGRFIRMEGNNRFQAKNYTLKLLIAAAYDLNPREITGGPGWVETDKFDVQAVTPGEERPSHDAQMLMLREMLTDRFHLTFHRQPKDFSIYEITVAKDGPKMKETSVPTEETKTLSTVYMDRVVMPARNASVSDLARVMQRAIVDRPVVDSTGLTGHYDFNLVWAPDETQFEGDISVPETDAPPLLKAMEEQLGLQMKATKGPVETMVIDGAEKPTEN